MRIPIILCHCLHGRILMEQALDKNRNGLDSGPAISFIDDTANPMLTCYVFCMEGVISTHSMFISMLNRFLKYQISATN